MEQKKAEERERKEERIGPTQRAHGRPGQIRLRMLCVYSLVIIMSVGGVIHLSAFVGMRTVNV